VYIVYSTLSIVNDCNASESRDVGIILFWRSGKFLVWTIY